MMPKTAIEAFADAGRMIASAVLAPWTGSNRCRRDGAPAKRVDRPSSGGLRVLLVRGGKTGHGTNGVPRCAGAAAERGLRRSPAGAAGPIPLPRTNWPNAVAAKADMTGETGSGPSDGSAQAAGMVNSATAWLGQILTLSLLVSALLTKSLFPRPSEFLGPARCAAGVAAGLAVAPAGGVITAPDCGRQAGRHGLCHFRPSPTRQEEMSADMVFTSLSRINCNRCPLLPKERGVGQLRRLLGWPVILPRRRLALSLQGPRCRSAGCRWRATRLSWRCGPRRGRRAGACSVSPRPASG